MLTPLLIFSLDVSPSPLCLKTLTSMAHVGWMGHFRFSEVKMSRLVGRAGEEKGEHFETTPLEQDTYLDAHESQRKWKQRSLSCFVFVSVFCFVLRERKRGVEKEQERERERQNLKQPPHSVWGPTWGSNSQTLRS